MSDYTEQTICAALARQTFSDSLCVVDRCNYTGNECDLLVVTRTLRVIDVEIKISRADLRADRKKAKWFEYPPYVPGGKNNGLQAVEWPRHVWKHYYAVAAPAWRDDMLDLCGAASGVIVITLDGSRPLLDVKRQAKPRRDYKPISAADAVRVARLASLRMWDAYAAVERAAADNAALRLRLAAAT